MEDFAVLILIVVAFMYVFDDEIFLKKRYDKKRESNVHDAGPEEKESGNPQKKEKR